jgi:prepilin-type N-terminal cleavage/methylation domain-containing protein
MKAPTSDGNLNAKTDGSARRGFALIEVLVAMSLSAVVLLGTADMLIRAIQVGGSVEERIRLSEAACAQLERLKDRGPSGPELEIGHHEAAGAMDRGTAVVLAWDVEETAPGTLEVVCRAYREGRTEEAPGAGPGRAVVRACVVVSKRLGF